MVSWAVTGATRGIGFGYIEHLSSDPNNVVFALIRSPSTAGNLQELASKRKNIHVIVTDIADQEQLAQTANEISAATNGSLDNLILNAGSAYADTAGLGPLAFRGKEDALIKDIDENASSLAPSGYERIDTPQIKANLLSNVYVIYAFLDLIRKGVNKKIVFVTSNSGDIEFTRITGFASVVGYSISKAGMNMIVTKLGIELGQEGIKTLSLSPGWVDTDAAQAVTGDPEVRKWVLSAFHKLDPTVKGPIPVADSVAAQLQVIQDLRAEDSGKVLTHHGDARTWF